MARVVAAAVAVMARRRELLMSEPVDVARITVTRSVSDDDDVVSIDATDDLSVIEGAGMLTMALDTWMRTNGLRDDDLSIGE